MDNNINFHLNEDKNFNQFKDKPSNNNNYIDIIGINPNNNLSQKYNNININKKDNSIYEIKKNIISINDLEDEFSNNYNYDGNLYIRMNNNNNNNNNNNIENNDINPDYFKSNLKFNYDEEELNSNNYGYDNRADIKTDKNQNEIKNEDITTEKKSEDEKLINFNENGEKNNNVFSLIDIKDNYSNINNIMQPKKGSVKPPSIDYITDWQKVSQKDKSLEDKYTKEQNKENNFTKKEIKNENIKTSSLNYKSDDIGNNYNIFNYSKQDNENLLMNKYNNFNSISNDDYTFENIINKDSKDSIDNKKNDLQKLNEMIIELKEENLNLKSKNQILNVTLIRKEQIIESLNYKIKELEINNKYLNSNLNKEKYLDIINKLKIERDELYNQNQKLTLGINSFNERLKEINDIYTKKNDEFINEINLYKMKLSEYKQKIIILKKKIDELYNRGDDVPRITHFYNNNNNNNNNNNYLNKREKTLRNLTPNRITNKTKVNSIRKKRSENEEYIKYNIDEKEDNLQKEQKQFVKNYRDFLEKLGN